MKSIVLLSGGLDSAVSLAWAQRNQYPILCLNFDYGQRSAANERVASQKLAEFFEVDLNIVEVPFLKEIFSSNYFIPNRNGFFLHISAAYAESLDASLIVTGFSREEAEVLPDNSFKDVEAKDHTLKMTTLTKVKVVCPTQNLSKKEIVNLGSKLEIPFKFIWPCYAAGDEMCGCCEGCQSYLRALQHNGLGQISDKSQMSL